MLLFALAGAITPGPVNLVAANLGVRGGLLGALPHVAGASLSYVAIVWLMGSGLHGVLAAYPQASQWMRYTGAAYLLVLCVRIATAPPLSDLPARPQRTGWALGLVQGGLVQSLNPKSWLWAMAGTGLFVADGTRAALLLFCAVSGVVCFASVATWAGLGRVIRQWLARPGMQVLFNRAMAALLALTVAAMLRPA
jgi:threonine/homoserine/homoserine lactone efflux protein